MGTMGGDGTRRQAPGRRLSSKTLAVIAMVVLTLGWHAVSGLETVEQLLTSVPGDDFALEMIETAFLLAHRGLRRLGLLEIGVGDACLPEA